MFAAHFLVLGAFLSVEIMLTYNNKLKHDSHGLTPSEAKESKHRVDVKMNLEMEAKRTIKYPHLDVDDQVKLYKKIN